MSIELKQAAQQALLALEKSQPHPSNPVIGLTNQDFIDHEETIRQLRTAIQQAEAQQPDNTTCKSVQKRLAAQQPATSEPVVSRNPFASRCYTMSESHLSGHRLIVGFEKLGDAQDAHEWVARQGRGDFTHPAPSVPADVVRVPLQILKDASEALGNFVSDHGWGDADMQAMDNLDAYIARHEANRAAMLAAK